MKKFILATSLGIVAIALQTVQANAQVNAQIKVQAQPAQQRACGQRAAIVEKLNNKYGESVQGVGLAANNSILEVFASAETGSWTITVTMPNGMTCLVASGQAWEAIQSGPIASGEDA